MDTVAETYRQPQADFGSPFVDSVRDAGLERIASGLRQLRDSPIATAVVNEMIDELVRATGKFGKFNSAHEGWAVFAEEADELWDHVKVNQTKRDIQAMRQEAIQCAAMAIRFAIDCCDEESGRR